MKKITAKVKIPSEHEALDDSSVNIPIIGQLNTKKVTMIMKILNFIGAFVYKYTGLSFMILFIVIALPIARGAGFPIIKYLHSFFKSNVTSKRWYSTCVYNLTEIDHQKIEWTVNDLNEMMLQAASSECDFFVLHNLHDKVLTDKIRKENPSINILTKNRVQRTERSEMYDK